MNRLIKHIKFAKMSAMAFGIVLAMNACESAVDDPKLKVSPNSPTDVADPDKMIAGIQLSLTAAHTGEMARMAGIFAGYFTGADRQYESYETYSVNQGDFNGGWGELYARTINNSQIIKAKYKALKNNHAIGAVEVMEAMAYGTLASLFGDVPFTEAVQLVNFPNPKYDPQASVFAGVQDLLDKAIANLSATEGVNGISNDLYFGGNAARWIALAHSLKARYYMYTKEYTKAITEANMGISSVGTQFNGASATAWAGFGAIRSYNLYFQFTIWDRSGYLGAGKAYLPTLLTTRGNPKTNEARRAAHYYQGGNPRTWVGGYFWATNRLPIFSYVENQLIAAEANARSGNDATALTHLNNARNAHNAVYTGSYNNYTLADFGAAGIANAGGGQTQSQALLAEIVEEQYVSLYGSLEGFLGIARTDNLINIPSRTTTNPIPERFLYPQSEQNSNTSYPGTVDLFTPTPVNN